MRKLFIYFFMLLSGQALAIDFWVDWDSCVAHKQAEYIDEQKDGWSNAKLRAEAYCDIKKPKVKERLAQENALKEREEKRRLEEAERKKTAYLREKEQKKIELEKKVSKAKRFAEENNKRVGDVAYTIRRLGIETSTKKVKLDYAIEVKRKDKATTGARIRCKGTVEVQHIRSSVFEVYSLDFFKKIIFSSTGSTETRIDWLSRPDYLLASKNLEFDCDVVGLGKKYSVDEYSGELIEQVIEW